MTKKDLVDKLAKSQGCSAAEAGRQADAVLEAIQQLTTRDGDKLILRGFGTFERKMRKGGIGRNPRTGEEVTVPASSQLKFKASKV
jgi:DNA-binding protein HU-beta